MSKPNTWCECDQMPGLHNPCDCDNERPVTDPIGWLKFQLSSIADEIVPGKTSLNFEIEITPEFMNVSQETTVEKEIEHLNRVRMQNG